MRAFVTGGDGFVGRWLIEHLHASGDTVTAPTTDITDASALAEAIADASPEVIYHLAAISNVGESWGAPARTFAVNATGSLNVIEAARLVDPMPTVLLVCSAEVYGRVTEADLPLNEDHALRPVSPYAASKVAAEFVGLQAFLAHGLPVIRVRAFNHIGPGQLPTFVVSSVAQQIAEVAATGGSAVRVGNLTARRDYTDVRDVVRAYRLLVERGTPGEVYNVCSGRAVAVQEIAERLLRIAGVDLTVEVDPERVRSIEVPTLQGDNRRLVSATGWAPGYNLDRTLADVLASWRAEVAAG